MACTMCGAQSCTCNTRLGLHSCGGVMCCRVSHAEGQMLPTILHIVVWHTLLQLMCRAWPAVCWRPAAAQSDVTQRQEVTGCRTVPTAKPVHCQPCCAQPFACPAVTGLPQAMLSALCSQILQQTSDS